MSDSHEDYLKSLKIEKEVRKTIAKAKYQINKMEKKKEFIEVSIDMLKDYIKLLEQGL